MTTFYSKNLGQKHYGSELIIISFLSILRLPGLSLVNLQQILVLRGWK